jgi:hypothetical protein
MLGPSGPGASRGGYKGAPLRSNASTRRRERGEARVGDEEPSSSHARASSRWKAPAVLRAAPSFAGRRKKRASGRGAVVRESPTLSHRATATTGARALPRRGAHACVSPSLGASRPVATRFDPFEGDLGGSGARERGDPLEAARRLAGVADIVTWSGRPPLSPGLAQARPYRRGSTARGCARASFEVCCRSRWAMP